jgi:hypothetical protein
MRGVTFDHPCDLHPVVVDPVQAIVKAEPKRKKVAIVGFAMSTRDLAPYNNPEWEVWGLNQLYRLIPRADRWFEIHSNYNEHVVEGTDHDGWLKNAQIPIYMVAHYDSYPNSVQYPLERMIQRFGRSVFNSTIDYAFALAIAEGFQEIGLWGIDLAVGTEYEKQRPSCYYYIGYAHSMGLTIQLPAQSALMKASHLYGYEVEPAGLLTLRELAARKQYLLNQVEQGKAQLGALDGALQEVTYLLDIMTLRDHGSEVNLLKTA